MPNEPWHLSKSVPISFIFAILMQTLALVWFVSNMNSSIQTNASDIVRHDTRLKALEDTVQGQAIALARIDENIKAIRSTLEAMATRP